MKDEEYLFASDSRDKKITARSAGKRRTHNGKRGAVRFPSDNLTKKEREAMNGECRSYRLNDPMKWAEFKSMPDDLKATYIRLLRERFNVPDSRIAQMMGVHKVTFSNLARTIGAARGSSRSGTMHWKEDEWVLWCNGMPVEKGTAAEEAETEPVAPCESAEESREPAAVNGADRADAPQEPAREEKGTPVPGSGNLGFVCPAEDALRAVAVLLGGTRVRISIAWETAEEDHV